MSLDARARIGSWSYPLAWFAVVAASPTLQRELWFVIFVALGAFAFVAAREYLHHGFAERVDGNPNCARLWLRILVTGNVAAMTAVGVGALFWPPLQGSQTFLLAIGGVVCAGGTMSVAIDPVLRYALPLTIIVPYSIGLLITGTLANIALVPLLFVSGVYIIRFSGAMHLDWWRAADLVEDHRRQADELQRLSVTDGLTGLSNRVGFDERLANAWAHAVRAGGILSVLIIDLDHFKQINDTYGHQVGDRCLEAAATAIKGCAQRRTDLVARYGGEEFAMLLPETASPAARAMAETVRAAIEAAEISHEGALIPLSASVGVATMAPLRTGKDQRTMVAAADEALYVAKRAGRNRVEAAAMTGAFYGG